MTGRGPAGWMPAGWGSGEDQLRIGDAEREQAAAALGEHYAQGRVTTEEHAERLDRIWAARTRADLRPVFRDLPGWYGPAAPMRAGAARRTTYWAGGVAPFRRGIPSPLVVVLMVLLVLTVLTHLPLILAGVLVMFFVLGRHRRPARARHWSR
ncbi:DUF1707 domain-containing protein [Nocardioides sp.]|uniref:DUF1707 SHOCT-like domain-containing protein n=1 Tax=Nocardioides sp. TaxID=35761 RepID=UPI0025E1EA22|nr:DUF1707 domain-containing protein [Nocardioides sp.]